jgi:flagellum-specific peptidoglycan hydrolase FlgJ
MNLNSLYKTIKHRICLLILLTGCMGVCEIKAATPPGSSTANEMANYQGYINEYYKKAIQLQKKYKIPASIILAQALLESKAGESFLALAGNNHFGLKCTDWQGLCINKNDDGKNDCFRKYLNAGASYEDHSRFLSERIYYKPLFKLKITDYKAWAKGLKQCGYATDPQYGTKLIQIIEQYQLYYYDTAKESDPPLVVKKATATKTSSVKAKPVAKK